MWGSGPEESASPQSGTDKQGDGEADVGRTMVGGRPHARLAIQDWVVTAVSSTARDVEMGQAEGFGHVQALAPGGSGTASHCVAWVAQA